MSNLSRRLLVASAAALPALAVPAIASGQHWPLEPDPIFAALDRWHELDVLHVEAIHAADAVQAEIWRNETDQAAADAIMGPVDEAQSAACGAAWSGMEDVFEIVPTTLAGMRAKIDFAFSVSHVSEGLTCDDLQLLRGFMETLYEAARLLAVRS
jgi:hypothetical protein